MKVTKESRARHAGLGLRIAACTTLILAAHAASAVPLAVVNGSFEDPVVTTIPGYLNSTAGPFCLPSACPSIPGWTFGGLGGLFRPNGTVFSPAVLDGAQVYFSDSRGDGSGLATQVLATTFQALADYTLTVAIGNRADVAFGDGQISLFAGGDPARVVATLDLSSIVAPPAGTFTDISLTASAAQVEAAAAVGQTIGILLGGTATGGQAIFDDVRLAGPPAIPKPETFAMIVAGLALLGFRLRRFRERDPS